MDDVVKPDVTLRLLRQDMAPTLFALTQANRGYLRKWLPWLDKVQSTEDTRQFIAMSEKLASEEGAPTFAIFYQQQLSGVVGFHGVDQQHRIGSLGYWIGQRFCGLGIATTAVEQLMETGFSDLGLNRIQIRCAVNNQRSRAIPERLGFVHEGTLRESEWLYDKFVDQALYALLASDRKTTRGKNEPKR